MLSRREHLREWLNTVAAEKTADILLGPERGGIYPDFISHCLQDVD